MDNRTDLAVLAFLGNTPYVVEEGPSGMNNTTKRIRIGGQLYILRIYNTHQDFAKADFEIRVLRLLAESKPALSFQVPEPLTALSGDTVVRLAGSGKLTAMFRYIEGRRPELRNPVEAESFGIATGELLDALSYVETRLGIGLQPEYPPYYELGSAHPLCSLSEVVRLCASPPAAFSAERDNLGFLSGEIGRIGMELEALRLLPHQLIHGDLNATNALAHRDGTIAALLDFEFTTMDLRAMEPAVCLWGLIPGRGKEPGLLGIWESLQAFWNGFRKRMTLESREKAYLPDLMQLRSLDVFIHFLGRYLDGVDGAEVLARQIPDTAARMRWVSANRDRLKDLLV